MSRKTIGTIFKVHSYFLVFSTIDEPPFIMHHLSPADDDVPGTSRGDMYEEIKEETLGIKKIGQPYVVYNITRA